MKKIWENFWVLVVYLTFIVLVIHFSLFFGWQAINPPIPESARVKSIQSDVSGYDTDYERSDDYNTERSFETYGNYDCSDFSSHDEAQEFFESEGGPDDDYHNLDRDGDGVVCETLL